MEGTFLENALHYASMGYRVFPCVPGGKVPATTHGRDDATTDPGAIETWWTNNPMCNIGLATDGLLIVDVDKGKNNPWLKTIDVGELMTGPVVKTPNGFHYWSRQTGDQAFTISAGVIAPNVDTRGNGGYVIVPPSVVGGKRYEWVYELDCSAELLPLIPGFVIEGLGVKVPLAKAVTEQIPSGQRNSALIRFAGSFRRQGMTADEIFQALQVVNANRCKPPLADREVRNIARSAARYEPDIVDVSLIYSHLTGFSDVQEADEDSDAVEPAPIFPTECLDNLPWLIRLAHEYTLATAIKPQPELTLGALLALFGAIFGRKVRDCYGTRTNVMILGLAPSGAGKEHPRQVNKEILFRAGADKLNGPERIASHAGVISSLVDHPARLFQIDEIGRLLQTMRDSSKNPHLFNVGTVLMQLFSSANTIWHGDAYADIAKVKKINQPCCCLFGTSVPDGFYAGLTPESLSDGLLARMIIISSPGYGKRQTPALIELPDDVLKQVRAWHELKLPGDLSQENPKPLLIPKTPEAHARHEAYGDSVHVKHIQEDEVRAAVWSRAPEKAAKLALIYACASATSPEQAMITLEAVEWAIAIVNYSTRFVLAGAENSVSTSAYEALKKRVWRSVRDGMTLNQLTRKTQWLRSRERMEILEDLKMCGAIEIVEEQAVGAGRPKSIIKARRKVL